MEYITVNLRNPLSVERGNRKKQELLEKGLKIQKEVKGSRTLKYILN